MRQVRSLLLITSLAIVGCATTPEPPNVRASWKHGCYKAVDDETAALAGPGAIDCGILHDGAPAATRKSVAACARAAFRSELAFRFAYSGPGTDSLVCRIAVRDAQGRIWGLLFDSDITGQLGAGGNNSAIWDSRCRDLWFGRGRFGSYFELRGCEDDGGAVARILKARLPKVP